MRSPLIITARGRLEDRPLTEIERIVSYFDSMVDKSDTWCNINAPFPILITPYIMIDYEITDKSFIEKMP